MCFRRRKRPHKKKTKPEEAVVAEEPKDPEKEKLGKWAVPLQKVLQTNTVDNVTPNAVNKP